MKKLFTFLLAMIIVSSSIPLKASSQEEYMAALSATDPCDHIFDAWSECLLCGSECALHDFDSITHLCNLCKVPCDHYDYAAEDVAFVDGICPYCGININLVPRWDGATISEGFAGGSGTKTDPYRISSGAELCYFAERVRNGETFESQYITLTSDIDLDLWRFPSIGITGYSAEYFAGCFDGAGHTIMGFYNEEYGLFGEVRGGFYDTVDCGTIMNLHVVGAVSPSQECAYNADVGGIVGRAEGATIVNCSFSGVMKVFSPGFYYYGGIIGEMEQGVLRDSVCDANIYVASGYRGVGGVLGGAEYNPPLICNCSNLGNINAQIHWAPVGGIVGRGSTVVNCQNRGAVLAGGNVGSPTVSGIAGNAKEIINCYNLGTVGAQADSPLYGGQICGIGNADTVRNCYNAGAFVFTLADGYVCNDPYDIISSDLTVSGCVGMNNCTEYSIVESCYSLASEDPVYFDYVQNYNQTDDYYYWNYVTVFDGQMTPDEMASDTFVRELNTNVSAIGKVIYTDYGGNETELALNSWKSGGMSPVFGVNEARVTLEVFSHARNGTALGEVSVSGTSDSYAKGDTVTLSAVYDGVDYRFIGWYADNDFSTVISNSKTYTLTVTDEMVRADTYSLTALYEKADTARITVNGGSLFTVEGSEYSSQVVRDFRPSKPITLHAKGENFAYWVNTEGRIVSYEARYTFIVAYDITLTAVYNNKLEDKYTVMFVSAYDQVILRAQMTLDDIQALEMPSVPLKTGCEAGVWSHDKEGILSDIAAGLEVIVIQPLYPVVEKTADVYVEGGTISGGGTHGLFTRNETVTVQAAPPAEGMKFAYWQDEQGRIVAYNSEYACIVENDMVLTAVYTSDESYIETIGVAEITAITKQESVNGISFTATFSIPAGGRIDYAGIVATSDGAKATSLTAENADYIRGGAQDELSGRFTWTKSKVDPSDIWYVRAYLIYTDASGVSHTVYSSLVSASYNLI